jgi:hypothetical protein
MKKFVLFTILFALATAAAFGQKRETPVKPPAPKTAGSTLPKSFVTEISTTEWSAIINALNKEDWTQVALLSTTALGKLKAENDKKQLAQLRYFYLYALAGKATAGKMTYDELKKTADSFLGKEFLMPSRQFLADCKGKVNYICPVNDNENAVRVTATNKNGAAIHSFEYVKLTEKSDLTSPNGQWAFVGGVLENAEINLYKQNIRILRLFFDKGFVNIVVSR